MATFSRIIKKAGSSIIPSVANRTRSLITTPLKNSTISLSSSSLHGQGFRTPTFLQFSSLDKKRPTSSHEIICAEEAEHRHKVVETPSEFPFKIEDKPGEQTITLNRKYRGDDIKVIVHMPTYHSSTVDERGDELDDQNQDQHKDSVSDPQSSIRLVVSSTNSHGTTLEYGVIAYPDDFSINNFCIKYANAPEENIYYKGPDYVKLDKNLQKEFKRRLKIRGIISSTNNFLHEYMANRDMYSSERSSNSTPTTTNTNQCTPESIGITSDDGYMINDEGIPVHEGIERYRKRGHPLVSAEEDIRKSGKKHKNFIWIPYPYTHSEKILWIEVPRKGFFVSESELQRELELDVNRNDDSEGYNPYRRLPLKGVGDPPVFSEEMDKILYPDLKHMRDPKKAWEECRVALKQHNDEMEKIKYPNGRPVVKMSDSDLEYYQVYCM